MKRTGAHEADTLIVVQVAPSSKLREMPSTTHNPMSRNRLSVCGPSESTDHWRICVGSRSLRQWRCTICVTRERPEPQRRFTLLVVAAGTAADSELAAPRIDLRRQPLMQHRWRIAIQPSPTSPSAHHEEHVQCTQISESHRRRNVVHWHGCLRSLWALAGSS